MVGDWVTAGLECYWTFTGASGQVRAGSEGEEFKWKG